MSRRVTGLVLAVLLGVTTTVAAQNTEPVPRFVVDVRGVTAGLPTSTGWTPRVSVDTEVPSRGLGVDVGAHVFVLRGRNVSLGVGGILLIARSSTSTVIEPTTEVPNPAPLPDVASRMTVMSPQLSVNFGRQLGWSYISAGLGRGRVTSTATLGSASLDNTVDEWTRTLNFGGGARWFVNDHVGVGFDARWHQFAAQEDPTTLNLAPRETMFVLGIGISVR
jgi:hypothetical protein